MPWRKGDDSSPEELEVEDVRERITSSRANQFAFLSSELGLDGRQRYGAKNGVSNGFRGFSKGFIILPDGRLYGLWMKFILVWAIYSSFFTPLEFGFFRGLPKNLFLLDIAGQLAFLVDIVMQFFVAYRDDHTYKMVYNRHSIALRYLKSGFIVDILSCLPWDYIYRICGRKEEVRYLLWLRLSRARKVADFFQRLEKNIQINYLFTRIVKLIAVELYCTHTAACIFYYLATTLPESQEGYTWIGSLQLGDYSYNNFREISIVRRYVTSLYFAIVTMATVGYGDIHAVNTREMIFVMIFVSFDMILGAYLIGNMTALIVKGSKTEKFRDKMTDLIKYMNRNRLGKEIRDQIKGHLRLQYESSYTEAAILQDIPVSIRAKISQTLYKPLIEHIPLFRGCSSEFINQMVINLHEEFFLPGEVILEQGNAVDQIYFVCHGMLEEVGIGEDGSEETVSLLEPNSSFGETAILCNIPQPHTVRVCELCRLLRLDKQSFTNVLQIYFIDGRTILSNLLEVKESNNRIKQLESDITFHIGKKEAELALRVNSAAHHGDLYHLKGFVRAGADPKKTDYDGRSALHLSASKGYTDITAFLINEGVDINLKDKFGNSPLLEAIKNGHDHVASLLIQHGACLDIDDAGSCLCKAVAKGNSDFVRRLLAHGVDPNSKDYDNRTPLHIAAAQGMYLLVKILLDAGANVFLKDRWGKTPLDEGRRSGSRPMVDLLESAMASQSLKFHDFYEEIQVEKRQRKKCTVLPFHPWDPEEKRREGIVMWIPDTLDELIKSSEEKFNFSSSRLLSEDAGRILDLEMISDGQRLYLVSNGDEGLRET
ncbi:potassium channel KOR1-like isoform X2 [Nymphaea colorata]|uniref:potassium channel KOR1-like isoform X2 n=1 Tax=Nymphaea colorata TaxID=210225 RepID=UPI00129EAB74|nr:potassium channel KOR1-like isoform X2 [Nymphaea colorata]